MINAEIKDLPPLLEILTMELWHYDAIVFSPSDFSRAFSDMAQARS